MTEVLHDRGHKTLQARGQRPGNPVRLALDPATDRRVIGATPGGEQGIEDVLDLTKADAGGEGDGGHLAELGRIADDRELGGTAQGLGLTAKPLIPGEEFVVGGGVEAVLELASVLVDRPAATAGLSSLVGARPVD